VRPADGALTPALAAACDAAQAAALALGEAQAAAGVPLDAETYAAGALKFGLVEAVFAWASGSSFLAVAQLTDIAEGTIVRTLVRLHETCRELRAAAGLLGDAQLAAKAEAAAAALKRDIVFSASLYVTSGPQGKGARGPLAGAA
jgi:antiviral helicase SKI2